MQRKAIVVAVLVVVLVGTVAARPSGLGVGLMGGEPAGFSFKQWTGPRTAIDGGLGWSYWRYGQAFQVHADFLWHTRPLIDPAYGFFALYIGVGGRLKLADEARNYPDMRVGIRVPFGMEYVINPAPLGFFLEIVPVVDLIPGAGFGPNGAAGFRYYLGR